MPDSRLLQSPIKPALLALIYLVLYAKGLMCVPSPSAECRNASRPNLCHFYCPDTVLLPSVTVPVS